MGQVGLVATIIREPTPGLELVREQAAIQQAAIEQHRLGNFRSLAPLGVFLHPGHAVVDRNARLEEDRLVVDGIGKTEWPVYVDYPENRETLVLLAGANDVLPHLGQ